MRALALQHGSCTALRPRSAPAAAAPLPPPPPPSRHRQPARRGARLHAVGSGSGGQPHPEEGEAPDGDSGLQDSLVRQLQFEIGKKKVDEFVENEAKEGLRQLAEASKEELQKLAELRDLQAEVAFNSALADINQEADEFQEKLRRSREEHEAAEAEQAAWEDDMAVARSQGQFFQTLYQSDKKRPVGMDAERLKERAARVQRVVQPARTELSSRVRYYLFAFLAFCLSAEVIADLQTDAPSAGQDVLYTLLVVALVVTALLERRSLPPE